MGDVIVIIGVGGMGEAMSNQKVHMEIGQVVVADCSAVGALADRASQFGNVVQAAHAAGSTDRGVSSELRERPSGATDVAVAA